MVSCEGLGRGGVQAVMMTFVRNLSKKYTFDALLFTNEARYYDEEFLSYGGRIIRIPYYNGCNKWKRKIDYYLRGVRLYRKIKKALLANGPYRAIHCHNEFEAAFSLLAAKRVGIPIRICHSHTVSTSFNIPSKVLFSLESFLINIFSTHKLGCSQAACDALYGHKTSNVVLNNPYNESIFDPKKYDHLHHNYFTLTQVGQFTPNKNQFFSIDIMKYIVKTKKDAVLKLVGFGDEKYIQFLKNKTKEYGLEEHIIFLDGLSINIPLLLSQSDAFLFPSHKEGFGMTLIEAQAMGLTCFVSDSVPRSTNVGGCFYLPLSCGAEKWANEILKKTCQRKIYDCSQFSTLGIVKKMSLIYEDM